jgi:hypothetical protein
MDSGSANSALVRYDTAGGAVAATSVDDGGLAVRQVSGSHVR